MANIVNFIGNVVPVLKCGYVYCKFIEVNKKISGGVDGGKITHIKSE